MLVLIFMGSFRELSVGMDTSGSYLDNWNAISMDPESWGVASEMEPGFCFFMAFFKEYIIDDYQLFYGLMFLVTMVGYGYMLRHFCVNPILGLAFLILFLHYTLAYNVIRQSLALSFTTPLIFLLSKIRKGNKYICFYCLYDIVLSLLVHRTMMVFLILPLIIHNNKLKSFFWGRKAIFMLLISYFLVFQTKKLLAVAPEISVLLSLMGDRYTGYMTIYLDIEEETISPYTSLLNTLIAVFLALIYRKDEKNDIFYLCFMLGVVLQNVLGAFSALFMRVGTNLLFFRVILFANVWYQSQINKKTIQFFRLVILIYGFIIFTNSIIKNFGAIVPYQNYLF